MVTKKKREQTQITAISNEEGDVPTDLTERESMVREYYEQLCANKLDNLYEMDKFLEMHKLLKLTRQEIENVSVPIRSKEIDQPSKNFQ